MLPCAHCEENPREKRSGLCSECNRYPRCNGCEIIFGMGTAQEMYDELCDACVGFKENIKANCVNCGRPKPTTESYFKRNGNFCVPCSTEATRHAADPTEFTALELTALFKRFRPEEITNAPEGGHLASALYAVQRATDERKYKEVDRIRKKSSRPRPRIFHRKSRDTNGFTTEGMVRGEGEEVFA